MIDSVDTVWFDTVSVDTVSFLSVANDTVLDDTASADADIGWDNFSGDTDNAEVGDLVDLVDPGLKKNRENIHTDKLYNYY